MQAEAITFDVGHTILFPFPSLGHVYAHSAAAHGITISPDVAEDRFTRAWKQVQHEHDGLIYGTNHDHARRFWAKVIDSVFKGDDVSPAQRHSVLHDLYEVFSSPSVWRIDDTWQAVIHYCRQAGIRVGLISNWDLRLRRILSGMGILDSVDAVVISAEVGIEKPNPEIFEIALKKLETSPALTLHVGDTWRDDVEGAVSVGIRPVWLNPHGHPAPDGSADGHDEIRSLSELPRLLSQPC